MTEFVKFPSVLGFTPEWLDTYIYPYYADTKAYVTEKLHGKSLTVEFDGETFLYGRRQDYIQKGDKFGDLDSLKVPLERQARLMYSEMSKVTEAHYEAADYAKEQGAEEVSYPEIPRHFKTIKLRGEFYGGSYNHPEVPKVANMGTVKSSGISYGQELTFAVYRIEVDDVVLDMHTMGMLCLSFGFPMVPLEFVGTLRECMAWAQTHCMDDSVAYSGFPLLDAEGTVQMHPTVEGQAQMLPKIEGNQREGNVVAPIVPITLPNGKALIIKVKNPKHLETKFEKTPQAPIDPLKGDLGKLYQGVLPKLTVPRFHNVQSHTEDFGSEDFMKAIGLVVQDAIDEFMLEASEDSIIWVGLTTPERKTLTKRLNATCAARLREMFFAQFK